jgi:hypothetical protein
MVADGIILHLLDIVHEIASECSDELRLRDLTPKAAERVFNAQEGLIAEIQYDTVECSKNAVTTADVSH